MPNNKQHLVPGARQGLNNLRDQIASQVGVNLQGYAGDLPTRETGRVGGQMVRTMIAQAEQQLSGGAAAGGFAGGTAGGTAGGFAGGTAGGGTTPRPTR